MTKSKEQLLADYKKSNKVRRARIVEKAGFRKEEDYLNFLSRTSATRTSTKSVEKTVKISGKAKLSQIMKKFQPTSKESDSIGPTPIDIVVAFDTTGSMSSYIGEVRKHVESLIKEWFENVPNLKMKIVAFGDYCDMESSKDFGTAYQQCGLTDDVESLKKFVKTAKNTSGGDGDEFYELVIKKIVEETSWRNGKRSILLIADDNPHTVGYSYPTIVTNAQIDWKEEAKKAKDLGIAIDTLSIHGDSRVWYKELSRITGGVYLPFKSSKQTGEMISAVAYARGASKDIFKASASTASTPEMTAVYKTLSTLREDE